MGGINLCWLSEFMGSPFKFPWDTLNGCQATTALYTVHVKTMCVCVCLSGQGIDGRKLQKHHSNVGGS